MKYDSVYKWFRLGLLNLTVVALYGTLMRYKIAFDFPFLEQKNLLHAHSHFAFSGWITQLLYGGLFLILSPYLISHHQRKKYHRLLGFNLFAALGMLVSFTIQGYKAVSISFSTLSIIISVVYAAAYIKDTKLLPRAHPSIPWAVAALLLNVLSAAGPLSLAYMMATKTFDANFYLGSVYYYLHFQYSGWFFFGSMSLIAAFFPQDTPSLKSCFRLFSLTVIPTFFLSILWAKLPTWLYLLTVIATLLQLFTWAFLAVRLWNYFKERRLNVLPLWQQSFFYASALALTLKFVLQTISVIPSLSRLVFGIRPIVIAYLHLVLLGVYSLFLLGYLFAQKILTTTKTAIVAAVGFLTGVVLNELFLGIQGLTAFAYIPVPFINELLFGTALLLLGSAAVLAISQGSLMKK